MKRVKWFAFVTLLSFAVSFSGLAAAQEDSAGQENMAPQQPDVQQAVPPDEIPPGIVKRQGTEITPPSSVSTPGHGAHTNLKIFVPAGHQLSSAVPDYTFAETPASIGCVYGLENSYAGCNPDTHSTEHPTGGWGAIAIVDAYHDSHIASDLAFFDSYWGLPTASFKQVEANSSFGNLDGLTASCSGTPASASGSGWDFDESQGVEWAHAMAPDAEIILVEACTNNLPDLLYANEVAAKEVQSYGGGDISNGWGLPESSVGVAGDKGGTLTEQQDDNFFFRNNNNKQITYFAVAGNSGAEVLYPGASPWVVSVGGTTINRDASGNFLSESCWSGSGGGLSTKEFWQNPPNINTGMGPWTNYQYPLFAGAPGELPARSTPDIAFDADPASGVYVYDTDSGGAWYIAGNTGVSSAALAGIVNSAGQRLGMVGPGGWYTPSELNLIYSILPTHTAYPSYYYDVTTGSNGHAAGKGYDQCTGVGTPRGLKGK